MFVFDNMLNSQLPGYLDRPVTAFIIHKDHLVHNIKGDLSIGLGQGFLGVVSRKNDTYFFIIYHGRLWFRVGILLQKVKPFFSYNTFISGYNSLK